MIAVYLAETGNTGKRIDDPTQPIHRLGALDRRYALQVVVGAADKQKLRRYSTPMDPRDIAFRLTLEQVAESTRSTSQTPNFRW